MAERDKDKPFDLAAFAGHRREGGLSRIEIAAGVLSVAWLGLSGALLASADGVPGTGGGALGTAVTVLALTLPVGLIWVVAQGARSARVLRQESARLQATVDSLRQAYLAQQQGAGMDVRPSMEKRIDDLARAQRETQDAIATFATRRDRAVEIAEVQVPQSLSTKALPRASAPRAAPPAPPSKTPPDDQPRLALGTVPEDSVRPLSTEEFVRALNFPEDTSDRAGFRALRRALEDRTASKLVRSAQDILTLLSEEGIYMDDLHPDRARPEIWRRFAQGERGLPVSALGGVRDRSCLALTAARMKKDPIFRDVAHHFLRQFDRVLVEFEAAASDQELNDLAETRTARAFMLLGRVTGMFG
ncbi:hypothetical protein BYZ73_04160 [Rhodovulum viride]|uniref:Uncharacterized protein n=1 Tax=Rhodovulum viride TaxID=1231134 RepID=A0ABX9DLY5_9RHOB|nr:hypothetical protein [Rhodovulum viride]RAP42396.1 hypothetical protein BYZ73_04160 [Rhodovulum viride]